MKLCDIECEPLCNHCVHVRGRDERGVYVEEASCALTGEEVNQCDSCEEFECWRAAEHPRKEEEHGRA